MPSSHPHAPCEGTVNLALLQMRCSAAKDENVAKAIDRIGQAAAGGAHVVCLSELFAGQYPCQSEDHRRFAEAEPIPGPTSQALAQAAATHGVVVVGSLFERRTQGLYHNTAVVFDADGSTAGVYRKMHIPDDPAYYEKFYFTPGDLGFPAFSTRHGRIAVLICWDQWYPEAARITSLKGAEILFYPTAIGWAQSQDGETNRQQYQAWQTVQRGHSVANGVFVVAVNRTGSEGAMNFWGGSFVSDPMGDLLYQAPHHQETIHVQEIDLARIDEIRVHWPFLRDRRIDSYEPILKRYIDK